MEAIQEPVCSVDFIWKHISLDIRSGQIPRYVRVNTIRWNLNEAITYLTARGFVKGIDAFETK